MPRVHVPESHAHDALGYVWTNYAKEISAAAGAYSLTVYERSRLSMREMEAARMRTAQINGCNLCLGLRASRDLSGHVERSGGDVALLDARDNTAPDERFYAEVAEWRTSDAFTERERLAIEYADRLGQAPQSMSDDEPFWERMHEHFGDDEIVDMTLSIGSWMALGRFAHVLDLDSICAVPERIGQA
jgi:alkylhydroperoxidase family enzyme